MLSIFYSILYFWNKQEKESQQHPAIHSQAVKPDDYILEIKDLETQHQHSKSVKSIEMAIQAIWKLEADVDEKTFDRLEQTIDRLELAHRKIIIDSIPPKDLLNTLEFALGNLAIAELEVAEKYSNTNQLDESKIALKYAQLHVKNALMLHSADVPEDSTLSSELHVLNEIDSLLAIDDLSQEDYSAALDQLIKEVDEVIRIIELQ